MKEYIHKIFAEKFGADLTSIRVRYALPGTVFVTVRMKRVTPEMEKIACAIREEFAEMDRDVSVAVVPSMAHQLADSAGYSNEEAC